MPTFPRPSRRTADPPADAPTGAARYAWLLRDRVIQAYLAAVAGLWLIWALPPLEPVWRAVYGSLMAAPFFLAWPAAASLAGLRRLEDPDERRFWGLLGTGLAFYVAGLLVMAVVPAAHWTAGWGATADTLLLLYYIPALLALEYTANASPLVGPSTVARWLRPAGSTVLTIGWLLYGILLPAAGAAPGRQAFWLLLVASDAILVALALAGTSACASPRVRSARRWMTWAFAATLASDLIEGFAIGAVPFITAGVAVVAWHASSFAFLAAARMRTRVAGPPAAPAAAAGRHGQSAPPGAHLPGVGFLVRAAFSLPLVHTARHALGIVNPVVEPAEHITITAVTVLLGGLAAWKYRLLEEDRTGLDAQERELRLAVVHARKMESIGRLAGGIAHEFNNLLTAIGGYADLVVESASDRRGTAEMMRHVRAAVDQATALTAQLLTFSRRQVIRAEPVDVNEAIRDFTATHRRLFGAGVDVRLDLDAGVPMVLVDPAQLDQVLMNLAVNGRDAMPGGGVIVVATRRLELAPGDLHGWPEARPGAFVRITVSDTGRGIPRDVLPHIFEPFFTTKRSGQGTGLGLAIVYGIVRQAGGRIRVESVVDRGTVFDVDLPAATSPAPRTASGAPGPASAATGTVLLVEDEQAVRDLVQSMLRLAGYHVVAAASGEDALRVAGQYEGPIDLLLTDVVMPGINGRELAERLLEVRPSTRVLFMTGYTDDAIVRHGVLDGAFVLLPKPFTRQVLIDTITRVLAAAPGGRR